MTLTILGNPITKKNSFQMARNPKTGAMFPVQSKAYKGYQTAALKQLKTMKIETIDYPVNVCYRFYMRARRPVDGLNLSGALDDILVKAGVLADDNRDIVASHDGTLVLHDKDNPRVEITITEVPDYEQWKQRQAEG